MSFFNLLWAIILVCWCDSIMGFAAATPIPGLGMASHRANTMLMDGGMGTAGGGNAGGGMALIPGGVSYHPHDSEEIERAVYDPGDELLRALNAEAAAAVATGIDGDEDYVENTVNDLAMQEKYELMRQLQEDIRQDQDIVSKSAMLMKLLEDPSVETLPVVYVEENPVDDSNTLYPLHSGMEKRSRYYRRYPWKRHSRNRGSTYEPEIRYACTPSKEDVFKLLVGLHENRNGNQHNTVNFCNRKRPAKAIFTNIRFLG